MFCRFERDKSKLNFLSDRYYGNNFSAWACRFAILTVLTFFAKRSKHFFKCFLLAGLKRSRNIVMTLYHKLRFAVKAWEKETKFTWTSRRVFPRVIYVLVILSPQCLVEVVHVDCSKYLVRAVKRKLSDYLVWTSFITSLTVLFAVHYGNSK